MTVHTVTSSKAKGKGGERGGGGGWIDKASPSCFVIGRLAPGLRGARQYPALQGCPLTESLPANENGDLSWVFEQTKQICGQMFYILPH